MVGENFFTPQDYSRNIHLAVIWLVALHVKDCHIFELVVKFGYSSHEGLGKRGGRLCLDTAVQARLDLGWHP